MNKLHKIKELHRCKNCHRGLSHGLGCLNSLCKNSLNYDKSLKKKLEDIKRLTRWA
jgi:hypothetical protein